MLKNRIWSGALIVAALLAAVLLLPPFSPVIPLVLLAITAFGLHEFYRMLEAAGIAHDRAGGMAAGLALIAFSWCGRHVQAPLELFVMAAVLAILFARQMAKSACAGAPASLAGTLLGFFYVAFLLNFLTRLLAGWGLSEGRWAVLYLVLVVKSGDVGAYAAGSRFGRRRLFPRISPGKTWEGALGGLAAGCLVSLLWRLFGGGRLGLPFSLTWSDALVLGFLLPAAGVFSDLCESLIKRAAGLKDSGAVIRGMGGVLDVIDSLLFAAPVLWVYLVWMAARASG